MAAKARLILCLWICLTATVHAATRVALVSTCGGKAGDNLLTLAEAKLSQVPGIDVLERQEVERVLDEQHLLRCGLSDAGAAMAVGRLLGVEVFASLETMPGEKDALGLVVFNARTGVKLWDSALPGDGVERAASAVTSAVILGLDKRGRKARNLTTLCLAAVRNATLPRELDSLCQSVGLLLERGLLDAPGLAVLERRHLEHVNKERSLPVDVAWSELVGSMVTVELEMNRGEAGNGIRTTALLKDGKGREIGHVSAESTTSNAADLAEELARRIAGLLQSQLPEAGADRAKEAQRFDREARFLVNSGDLTNALPAVEAAYALEPTNLVFYEQLGGYLGRYADELLTRGQDELPHALDIAERVLDISEELHRRFVPKADKLQLTGVEGTLEGYGMNSFWDKANFPAKDQDVKIRERLLAIQKTLRQLQVEVVNRRARAQVNSAGTFDDYTYWVFWKLLELRKFEPSSAAWTTDMIEILGGWLKLLENQPLREGWFEHGTRMMARLCYQAKAGVESGAPYIAPWQLQAADRERLNEFFRQMTTHPDPAADCYGRIGQLALELHEQATPSSELLDHFQTTMRFIRQKIAAPGREPSNDYVRYAYGAALDLIDLWPDPGMRRGQYVDLYNFMLERKELEYWVVRMVTDPEVFTFRHYSTTAGNAWMPDVFPRQKVAVKPSDYGELIARSDQVLALLRSGKSHDIDTGLFSYDKRSFEGEVAAIRQEIFKQRPDLAPKTVPPWTHARLLWEVPRSGAREIAGVAVAENAVYAATQGAGIEAVRIPFAGGQPVLLGRAPASSTQITCATVYEGQFFVGTDGDGIFAFSADRGETARFGLHEGLPSGHVQSLACVAGKLYAGLQGGYLVTCDLQSKQCAVIASSRRREKHTVLDDRSPPFEITSMLSDPRRHRVLLLVSLPYPAACDPLLGLWEVDTPTGKLTQLYETAFRPVWMHLNRENQVLISFTFSATGDLYGACEATPYGLIAFTPATDEAHLLYAWDNRPAGPKLPSPKMLTKLPMHPEPPFLLLDGWLWFGHGDSGRSRRLSPDGQTLGFLPSPTFTESTANADWKSLELTGDGNRIIAADARGIWLLTLPDKESK